MVKITFFFGLLGIVAAGLFVYLVLELAASMEVPRCSPPAALECGE